eukprot:767274-Hanusia_phi.AAC.6
MHARVKGIGLLEPASQHTRHAGRGNLLGRTSMRAVSQAKRCLLTARVYSLAQCGNPSSLNRLTQDQAARLEPSLVAYSVHDDLMPLDELDRRLQALQLLPLGGLSENVGSLDRNLLPRVVDAKGFFELLRPEPDV